MVQLINLFFLAKLNVLEYKFAFQSCLRLGPNGRIVPEYGDACDNDQHQALC